MRSIVHLTPASGLKTLYGRISISPTEISLGQGVHSGWKSWKCWISWKSWKMSPFSEFGWNSWKTIGFSPALAGKAGILFLGLILISGIIRWKTILSSSRAKEEEIFQYRLGQAFFHQVDPGLEAFPMFCHGG